MNAVEIEEAVSKLAEAPFDPITFSYAFLEAFGNKETTLKRLRTGNTNQSDVGGVLQRNNIHIKVCGDGEVPAALTALRDSPATAKQKAKFYVELSRHNPDWDTRREDLNHFFARLIFCFFAEDTGIFQDISLFTHIVELMTKGDELNTHKVLETLFRAMNIPLKDRAASELPGWSLKFPYVNGGLFSGSVETPKFSKIARSYLLFVGKLNWKLINPDIFGSMIQAVADDEERGALGMH